MRIKVLLLISSFLILHTNSKSQSVQDLFDSDKEITWLGIDFHQIQLVGDFDQLLGLGEKDANQIRDIYFPAWNRLFFEEPDKYDLNAMFKKRGILFNKDLLAVRNMSTDTEKMRVHSIPYYTEEDIKTIVDEYDLNGEGIAAAFIAECFNKTIDEAVFHFVLIDKSNDNVLLHERISTKPGGFGIRNYWARTIFDTMQLIKKSYFKRWKKTYN